MKIKYILIAAAAVILGIHIVTVKSDNYIKDRVVKITSEHGLCSGEQVRAPSGIDYVLTASHCRGLIDADGYALVTREDGRSMKRKVIAEDPASDLLLFEGIPGLRGLDIAQSSYRGEGVKSYTHGYSFSTYKTEGALLDNRHIQVIVNIVENAEDEAKCAKMPKQKVVDLPVLFFTIRACVMDTEDTATTTFLSPGSSGGPIVDASGDVVGVCSAGGDGYAYLVTLQDIQKFLSVY